MYLIIGQKGEQIIICTYSPFGIRYCCFRKLHAKWIIFYSYFELKTINSINNIITV